jgi:hypothetical protein
MGSCKARRFRRGGAAGHGFDQHAILEHQHAIHAASEVEIMSGNKGGYAGRAHKIE